MTSTRSFSAAHCSGEKPAPSRASVSRGSFASSARRQGRSPYAAAFQTVSTTGVPAAAAQRRAHRSRTGSGVGGAAALQARHYTAACGARGGASRRPCGARGRCARRHGVQRGRGCTRGTPPADSAPAQRKPAEAVLGRKRQAGQVAATTGQPGTGLTTTGAAA